MRKCMALFLALLMLLGACSAAAEALPSGDVYSVEAADEFCNAWNQYFAEQGIPLNVGYNLAEGQDRIESFAVMLNVDEAAYDYRSGLIPAESVLYFQYDTTDGTYGLCVFSKLKDELEKAVIYTDDRVINNLETGNGKKRIYSGKYALSSNVFCAHCGDVFQRTHWNVHGRKKIVWRCVSRLHKKDRDFDCPARTVTEADLHAAVVAAVNEVHAHQDAYLPQLKINIEKAITKNNNGPVAELDGRYAEALFEDA